MIYSVDSTRKVHRKSERKSVPIVRRALVVIYFFCSHVLKIYNFTQN